MSGFSNPIIGGGGALAYPSIHSPDFIHGLAGWTVNKDGSAEFSNVTMRGGTIVGGTILQYNGVPATGNLITVIATQAGNDGLGNSWGAGISSLNSAFGTSAVVNSGTIGLFAGVTQVIGMSFQEFQAGNNVWIFPTGDTTGVKDATAINNALAAGQAVNLTPGKYYVNVKVTMPLDSVVRGPGPEVCTVYPTGADPGFLIQNAGAFTATQTMRLTGINIDGTHALAGSTAYQAGDVTGLHIDVWTSNFTGGNNGSLLLNAHWWTEQGRIKQRIVNCDGGFALMVSGSGTSSWDRTEFDLDFVQGTAGQEGVVLASGTLPPILLEPVLRIHGNFAAAGSPGSNAVIKMVATGSKILQPRLEIGVECGGGTTGPQTIFFGDPTCQITGGNGVIEFYEGGGGTFVPSNNNYNFWFAGPVLGDTTLLKAIPLPANAQQITVGFPAGWTGPVTVQAPRGDGWVHIDVQITVAAATVVTNGEVILTAAIPAWARPTGDKFVALILNQAMVPARVQSTGNLQYLGPGFTGPASLFGQMVYLNST